ncbi:MAG: cell surface protein SprA, partial [bacterium]|nr:cell surface protein SprA [bacterium]
MPHFQICRSFCLRNQACFLFLIAFLVGPSAVSASPGIRAKLAPAPLEPFLIPEKPGELSISTAGPPLLPRRRSLVQTRIVFHNFEDRTLLAYRTVGGQRYGLPVLVSLGQFAHYKYAADLERFASEKLREKAKERSEGGGGGLVNFTIPVNVPKGLSAITGEGQTNIKITGSRRIDLSGINQSTAGQAQTASTRSAQGFTINFEQESQLNVQGTIGDRITINLQQDSRGQVDIGESLKLRYEGEEDGIIQEIEAGSTSLSLSGTRLIGFNSPTRGGLFGIKGRGRLGGLDITVVTTQDKGANNRKSFQGQAEETAIEVRDYDYLEDQYFFLDKVYRTAFPNQPAGSDLVDVNSMRVFINDFNDINDIEQRAGPGAAFADWNTDGTPNTTGSAEVNGGVEEGSFHELDRDEFLVDARGYLIMKLGRINPGFALAVAYQTSDGRTFGDLNFIQDPASPTPIRLKLIKARQQRPEFPTWDLSWRNVYSLRSRVIEPEGFELEIFRDVSGQEPVDNQQGTPYLQVFELDTHTNGSSESSPPDNIIDIDGGNELPGLNLALGHLVFPDLEPFGGEGTGASGLETRVPEIYSTTNTTTRAEKTKYFMRIRSRSQATEFNLGFGIIEDSEEVILNNRRLVRGQDYTIDYQFGSVRLMSDAATLAADPSANLIINYGSKDIFGFSSGQKSLLGIRVEHPFRDKQSLVGMTLLYSSQSAPAQRVRVGEEPARTLIWDANGRFRFKPQILTDFVNSLPFVTTETPSSLNLDVEIAQSLPNPNTKNVAYIDDFEGSENRLSLSMFKFVWNRSSTPTLDDAKINLRRGRLTWYNPVERDRISIYDIQPGRDDIPVEQSIVDIFTLRFEPFRSYADGTTFPETSRNPSGGTPQVSWGGIQSYLVGLDLSRSKFLEIWIRGNTGKLHIDLGEMSEKQDLPLDARNPRGSDFRTEDKPLPGFPTGDDVATTEEDIGLDGLTDAQEDSVFKLIYPNFTVPDDPSADNFKDVDFTQTDSRLRYPPGVNGTQSNNAEREQSPDTEDLNRNGILDTRDSYLRYSVDLRTDLGIQPGSRTYSGPSVLVVGSQSDPSDQPWRLLRIPLRGKNAPRTGEGNPDTTFATAVDFARVWIEHDDTTTVNLYALDIVGSDWLEDESPSAQAQGAGDFKVATIGTDNNVYRAPPDLEREVDPTTGREQLERSLALKFEDLQPGQSVSASRTFFQGQNYTQYGLMTMFVHGGNPSSSTYERTFPVLPDSAGGALSPVELFLRFAPINGDTLNFYEYRKRVYRDWAENYNNFEIDLELMTQLKGQLLDLRSAGRASSDTVAVDLGEETIRAQYKRESNFVQIEHGGATYIVRGDPALSNIKSFTVGVRNRGDFVLEGENEIWLDELRLDQIRKKKAVSALLDLQTVLADLGNLTVRMERRSGDFQDLQGRATGNTTTQISLDSQLNLNKFLPEHWNTNIPVRYNYNRNSSIPRIRTGSDIVLTPEQKKNESNINSGSRFNISLRKTQAKENPRFLSQIFFDKVNVSLNYNTDNSVSGAITRRDARESNSFSGTFSYDLNFAQRNALELFKWFPLFKSVQEMEFFYLPSSIRYNMRVNRNTQDRRSFSAVSGDTSNVISNLTENFTLSETFSLRLAPMRSLTAGYDITANRDLRNAFQLGQLQFGRETSRNQDVDFNHTPRLSRWFSINTQYSARYNETVETGGQNTEYGNARRGLTVRNNNRISARFSLNLPAMFQPMARPTKDGKLSIKRLVGRMGSTLQALQINAFRNKQYNFFGLRERPGLKFQLGLTDTTRVPIFNTAGVTRINSRTITDQASASSGLQLPAGFQTSFSANYTHGWTFGNANTEEEKIEFPSLTANWRSLERLPVFRWLLASSNVQFTYKKEDTRRGDGGLGADFLTNDTEQISYNPLFMWQSRWKNQMNTTVRMSQSTQNDLRYQ